MPKYIVEVHIKKHYETETKGQAIDKFLEEIAPDPTEDANSLIEEHLFITEN